MEGERQRADKVTSERGRSEKCEGRQLNVCAQRTRTDKQKIRKRKNAQRDGGHVDTLFLSATLSSKSVSSCLLTQPSNIHYINSSGRSERKRHRGNCCDGGVCVCVRSPTFSSNPTHFIQHIPQFVPVVPVIFH